MVAGIEDLSVRLCVLEFSLPGCARLLSNFLSLVQQLSCLKPQEDKARPLHIRLLPEETYHVAGFGFPQIKSGQVTIFLTSCTWWHNPSMGLAPRPATSVSEISNLPCYLCSIGFSKISHVEFEV